MPYKDVLLLFLVGGLVLMVWFAFRNLEALATTSEEGKPPEPQEPLPPRTRPDDKQP